MMDGKEERERKKKECPSCALPLPIYTKNDERNEN